jgi:septal ring factor EnvC (AmiA/AmiB activator)
VKEKVEKLETQVKNQDEKIERLIEVIKRQGETIDRLVEKTNRQGEAIGRLVEQATEKESLKEMVGAIFCGLRLRSTCIDL